MVKAKTTAKATAKPKSPSSKAKSPSVAGPFNNDTDWRTRDDADTLKKAMAIKSDASRLKAAQEFVTKEMEALKQVSRMK